MAKIVDLLESDLPWGFDTETTGLQWFKEDTLFAMSLVCGEDAFYYDTRTDSPEVMQEVLRRLFAKEDRIIYIHNAKFDMHFTKKFFQDVKFNAQILDTEVLARIWKNDLLTYSLDAVAKLFGLSKDDAVKKWIKKNKAYRTVSLSLDEEKVPEYIKVPIEIMSEYALKDARIVLEIGERLMASIRYEDQTKLSGYSKSLFDIVEIEKQVTKVLFDMEETGVLVDIPYVRQKFTEGKAVVDSFDKNLRGLCGDAFKDSAKFMKSILEQYPEDLVKTPRTKTGLLSLTDEVLETHKNPVSALIRERRKAYKEVGTYYSSFLDLADKNGRIHTNFKQTGAATGRMSCREPNLQNISGEENDKKSSMRKCFIPDIDYSWVSIDYIAQEMAILADLSGEDVLIKAINNGEDVHQTTADLLNITRKEAKQIGFSLLYGSGIAKLCTGICSPTLPLDTLQALGFRMRGLSLDSSQENLLAPLSNDVVAFNEAELEKAILAKNKYFNRFIKVQGFTKAVINKASKAGWVCNNRGRVYLFDKKFSYKAVNYVIQGAAADCMKSALITIHKLLNCKNSKLVNTIHDEVNIIIYKNEEYLIPEIQKAMQDAYIGKSLKLTTSVEISSLSWGDC